MFWQEEEQSSGRHSWMKMKTSKKVHEFALLALDRKSGKILWKMHLIDDFGGNLPTWGMTATPLLVDDKLIVRSGELARECR